MKLTLIFASEPSKWEVFCEVADIYAGIFSENKLHIDMWPMEMVLLSMITHLRAELKSKEIHGPSEDVLAKMGEHIKAHIESSVSDDGDKYTVVKKYVQACCIIERHAQIPPLYEEQKQAMMNEMVKKKPFIGCKPNFANMQARMRGYSHEGEQHTPEENIGVRNYHVLVHIQYAITNIQ